MSRYGFLKLAVIGPPDFDEFISRCKDKANMKRMTQQLISGISHSPDLL